VKNKLLLVVACGCLLTFSPRLKADSINTFSVNASFAGGFVLDATLVADVTSGVVNTFEGDLFVPATNLPPFVIPAPTNVPITGMGATCIGGVGGCIDWGGTADGFSFLDSMAITCSGFVGFQGGALPPSGCTNGFMMIFGGTPRHEVAGSGMVSGSVVPTPEPSSLFLFGAGVLVLAAFWRSRQVSPDGSR